MIDKDTYLAFCDQALVSMRDIVVDLGDERANQQPPIEGANSSGLPRRRTNTPAKLAW